MALSITGLRSSSTGGTTATIGAGTCRDATDTADITIPAGQTRTVDVTVSGAGGIASGTVQADTSYALYVVQQGGTVACTLATEFDAPPLGAAKYRRIGSVLTNGSAQVVAFTQTGTGNARMVTYDATPGILTVVDAGSSASFRDFDLGPANPVTGRPARLSVTPGGAPTHLRATNGQGAEIALIDPTILGFTPPIGSNKGSFQTEGSSTTTIRVTGYGEQV
ncbi:MAG: hypothetical protein ABMB14_29550 [Myxococcota bacterium]